MPEQTGLSGTTEGLRNFAAQYGIAISDPDLIRRQRSAVGLKWLI